MIQFDSNIFQMGWNHQLEVYQYIASVVDSISTAATKGRMTQKFLDVELKMSW